MTDLPSNMAPADLAYRILSEQGQPMHYKQILEEIIKVKRLDTTVTGDNKNRLASSIHTDINMDNRFMHLGRGVWGLRKWSRRATRVVVTAPERPAPVVRRSRLLAETAPLEETRRDEGDAAVAADPDGEEEGSWEPEEEV